MFLTVTEEFQGKQAHHQRCQCHECLCLLPSDPFPSSGDSVRATLSLKVTLSITYCTLNTQFLFGTQ